MDVRMTIGARAEQRLVMTPMLQLAIRLLQLSTIELQELLQQELTENPMLEEVQTEEGLAPDAGGDSPAPEAVTSDTQATEPVAEVPDLPFDISEVMFGPPDERTLVQQEEHEETRFENFVGAPTTLADELARQIEAADVSAEVRAIAEYIVGNLNDDGYVPATLMFDRALELVARLDPAGVGARDLRECFLIQIKRERPPDPVKIAIIEYDFDKVVAYDEARHSQPVEAARVAQSVAWGRFWFDEQEKERVESYFLKGFADEIETDGTLARVLRKYLKTVYEHARRLHGLDGPPREREAGNQKEPIERILDDAKPDLVQAAVRRIVTKWETRITSALDAIVELERCPGRLMPVGDSLAAELDRELQDHAGAVWPELQRAMHAIVAHLDGDGFLRDSLEQIAKSTPLPAFERALALVQSFEPRGVGARNLRECLLIQLRAQPDPDPVALEILEQQFDALQRCKYPEIARALKVDQERILAAVDRIAALEPKPGRAFTPVETRYVVPDVHVRKVDDDYVVILNEDGIPRLRINSYYRSVIGREQGDEARRYVEDRLRSAVWLIKSIQQRQKTLYKVTKSIVQFQRVFLDKGLPHLRPLSLRHVAEDIQMHESTVSRVTNSKYVETPQGVFPLKFFFHSGIAKSQSEDVSSVSVKKMIEDLVAKEDALQPLSDQDITKNLKQQGLTIARRTVAKYREELGILPSHQRRLAVRKRS